MMLRLLPFALGASLTLLAACSGRTIFEPGSSSGCQPVTCKLGCEHGFLTGADGCATCQCKPPPGGCDPVTCDLYCENGFATGPDGCQVCSCAPSACEGPNPAGCIVNACPPDAICDTTQGCTSSSCSCDAATGTWACDDDCGGGICVPAGGACSGPDPSGCSSKGCPMGEICDTNLGCLPSGCACDAETGTWGCTADCGGGICVPDPTGCSGPYPGGCEGTGCPSDQTCMETSGVCVPSSCVCDAAGGTWVCTDDCGGGVCVDG